MPSLSMALPPPEGDFVRAILWRAHGNQNRTTIPVEMRTTLSFGG
jgi:hypothetical protein